MAKKNHREYQRHFRIKNGCPFEAARAIAKILGPFYTEKEKILRWAMEEAGFVFPIKIVKMETK